MDAPENLPRRHFLAVALILLVVAILLRAWLVYAGGQFSFWDESRYYTPRESARLITEGQALQGLALASSGGDHVGFKLLGILPALIERQTGPQNWIPAAFFSLFSVANIALLALLCRRLGLSREASLWSMAAAATSASLLIYSRHVLPYDTSLTYSLVALLLGLAPGYRPGRSLLVGLLAGCSFLIYMGYWTLAGVMMLLHLLAHRGNLLSLALRAVTTGAGFLCAPLLVLLINKLSHGDLLNQTKAFSTTINWGDYTGHSHPWEYLYHTEGLQLFLWLAALFAACWLFLRQPRESARTNSLALPLAGFVTTYGALILVSTILHKFVVHGRLDRQIVPFLIILFGGMTARLLDRLPGFRAGWRGLLALTLAVNCGWMLWPAFTQVFPLDFAARGAKIIAQASNDGHSPGSTYLRFVNVSNFIWEPEVLWTEPLETLLAARHPLEYLPAQYEGISAEQRRIRRAIDHRMRVVRMPVRPNERILGEDYGLVELTLRFPAHRQGFSEPLLSIGPRREGDLFFVQFGAGNQAVLGFENMQFRVIRSAPFEYDPTHTYRLRLFVGSLLSPQDAAKPDMIPLRRFVHATLDGQPLITDYYSPHASHPWEVFAGVNTVDADSALAQFSGQILQVHRGGLPPVPAMNDTSKQGAYLLKLSIPPHPSGQAEPLLSIGEPGRAVLVYLRRLPGNQIRVGADVWSVGAPESSPTPVDPGKPLEISIAFGSLYPPVGAPSWGSIPLAEQQEKKATIEIRVNGKLLLKARMPTPEFDQTGTYIGKNPIGGSMVIDTLSGSILATEREWLKQD